jgi:DNA-binding transcriptional LysR family regulator
VLAEFRSSACELTAGNVVRLAAEPVVSLALLAPILRRTEAVLEIDEGLEREDVLASVLSGRRDAGCIAGDAPAGFDELVVHRDRWVLVTRRGEEPAMLGELVHVGLRGVTAAFPLAHELPSPVATAESPATLAAMVFAGIGAAVTPASLVQPWRAQLDVHELAGADFAFDVRLVWASNRPLKPALRVLAGHVAAAAA